MAPSDAWRQEGASLVRDLEFEDFRATMAFVNSVAQAAEEVNHHPDIAVHDWNKVRLAFTTHNESGLTDADRAMAERVDALV